MSRPAGSQLQPDPAVGVDIPSTPALVLDLDIADANIRRMAELALRNRCKPGHRLRQRPGRRGSG